MKIIELNTACADNGGNRHVAGEKVVLGTKSGQITPNRAEKLVSAGAATEAAAPATKPA